jgi:hypothetical protein
LVEDSDSGSFLKVFKEWGYFIIERSFGVFAEHNAFEDHSFVVAAEVDGDEENKGNDKS